MYLSSLKLFRFRNFLDQRLDFNPSINLILGNNAQGKTNLVESIYLLGALRSFRTTKQNNLINFDHQEASILGDFISGQDRSSLGVLLKVGSKQLLINGENKALVDYYGRFLTVSFTPDDLELVKGSPDSRRSLVDKLIVDLEPTRLKVFRNYAQAVKNKNALLKSGQATPKTIESWNQVLSELSPKIAEFRLDAIKLLESKTADKIKLISAASEQLKLFYESDLFLDQQVLNSDQVMQKYQQISSREFAAKRCLIGCHLDDVKILLNQHDARTTASQGQSRSLALALKLAVLDLVAEQSESKPTLILDDFDAEFDQNRLKIMCELISSLETQVFITSTNLGLKGLFQGQNIGIVSLANNSLKTIS